MEKLTFESCLKELEELNEEYMQLEETHREYSRKIDEIKSLQAKQISGITHQRYRSKQITENFKNLDKCSLSEDQNEQLNELEKTLAFRKNTFREFEDTLPHQNGVYLKIILGSVNVSLLSKKDKFLYKEDYEKFKLYITMITIILAVLLIFIQYRVIDAAFQFLLVWYYCTLTIREHILKVNGSRIKGWWITHHFISTVCAGLILIWPDSFTYNQFRMQFVCFSFYISVVQVAQYYYQSGTLYRLRALGEKHNMDITVEGFQSWMWKGLSFVLPFLIGGYVFQLYNSYILFQLSFHEDCKEWQVYALGTIFLVLFLGNTWTTFALVKQKIQKSGWMKNIDFVLRNKYRFSNFTTNLTNKVHAKLHNN